MGLDITAYRNLKPAPHAEVDEDGNPVEWDRFTRLHWNNDFPRQAEGLELGVIYEAEETIGFRAGTYGLYNEWRDWLAQAAGYRSARQVWADKLTEGPFVELINFSDCEGVIGAAVSAKLAKDFASMTPVDAPDEWFLSQYEKWKEAFTLAADNGAVEFH